MDNNKLTPEEVETVYQKYKDDVWHFLLSLCRNPDEAADLFQGVFLKITEKAGEGYILRDKVRPFLFKLTYNHFIDSRRTKKVVYGAEKLAESTESKQVDLSPVIHRLILSVVEGDELPERCRAVLKLRLIGGYSITDMTGMVGVSRPTIYADLETGLEHLREKFEAIGLTPDILNSS